MPENESLVRSLIGAYAARKNPNIEVINDIKTAVSEALSNSIIHGYSDDATKDIHIDAELADDALTVSIRDFGVGIADIKKATSGFFTTKPELEHSGLGFTIMQAFMDSVDVNSKINEGTTITMKKRLV
jgi:stage II sporulation protein AB (anti-sigma F factor)